MPIEHLPKRFHPVAYRLRGFLMTNSTALLILAGMQIAVGFYYLPGCLGDPLSWHRPNAILMPVHVWAWVHITIGVIGIIAAIMRRCHLDTIMLMIATGLNLSWASSLLVAAVDYSESVLWLVAVLIFALTVSLMWAIWRGKRGDIPFRTDRGQP